MHMTRFLRHTSRLATLLLLLHTGVALAAHQPASGDFGVLVMAHGGGPEWNQAVLSAVEPVGSEYPLEVAFGMADACSLQEATRRLEARGARRIAVVRLFVSGESWLERTEQILGLRDGAPAAEAAPGALPAECTDQHQGGHGHHRMALFRLESKASFVLTREGLLDAPEMGDVLAERARGLSQEAAREDVLILAHGPEDDSENERWLAKLDARAEAVRAALPFHRVQVETLREDWPEERTAAEERVRAFVAEGQTYAADQQGLLPDEKVTGWIARQVEELRRAGFSAPGGTGEAQGTH
jgi:hypothetical protein